MNLPKCGKSFPCLNFFLRHSVSSELSLSLIARKTSKYLPLNTSSLFAALRVRNTSDVEKGLEIFQAARSFIEDGRNDFEGEKDEL